MNWNCKGKLFTFDQPKIMAIVNCTPDSFFEESRTSSVSAIEARIAVCVAQGADIVDIGGYSTRPGAVDISAEEEWNRIQPAISFAKKHYPKLLISVDTFRSEVAEKALNSGADIINDVSAGTIDPLMFGIVAKHRVPLIIMHMRGTPQTMNQFTDYNDLTTEVLQYFSERISAAHAAGILDLAIDPGFGFAKTLEQNYELFSNMERLKIFDLPLLVGISRKSMIYKLLETDAKHALNGTTALNALALSKGAKILRVHDVREAREVVNVFLKLSMIELSMT